MSYTSRAPTKRSHQHTVLETRRQGNRYHASRDSKSGPAHENVPARLYPAQTRQHNKALSSEGRNNSYPDSQRHSLAIEIQALRQKAGLDRAKMSLIEGIAAVAQKQGGFADGT
jgi:hypothetical protein